MSNERPTVSEKLDDVLDLSTSRQPQQAPIPVIEVQFSEAAPAEKQVETDFDYARRTLHGLIESGKDLTLNSLHFAKERQDPDSVKASASAQKETRESVMALIDLHRTRKEIERLSAPAATPVGDTTINQTVFYGSTADMLKMMKEMPNLPQIDAAEPIEDNTPHRREKKS